MNKKNGLKHKISMAAYKQNNINKHAVEIKKSFDEVNKILNPRNTK